jgi:hypothetical protein
VDRAADLRADYDRLGALLADEVDGSKASALVQRRMQLSELLEALEAPVEVPLVDQLAARRQSATKAGGAASRRRKSG